MARMIKYPAPCYYCGETQQPRKAYLQRVNGKWYCQCIKCWHKRNALINPEWEKLGPEADAFTIYKDAYKAINIGPPPNNMNKERIEQERKRFEEWGNSKGWNLVRYKMGGAYKFVQEEWTGWLAALGLEE